MATGTGGTTSTTALTTLQFAPGSGTLIADVATIASAIWDDRANVYPNNPTTALNTIAASAKPLPGAFSTNGLLYIPNRGVLEMQPGDYVMVDTVSGWPILVSRTAIGITGTLWNP